MKKLTVIALVVMMSTMTFAQRGQGLRNGDGSGMGMRAGTGMNFGGEVYTSLTDTQKEALRAARLAHEKVTIPLQAEMNVARIEYHEMIANAGNRKNIDKKQAKIASIQNTLAKERTDHLLNVRKIVGEDNFKIMHAGMRNGRRGGGMGQGTFGGRPGMKAGRSGNRF